MTHKEQMILDNIEKITSAEGYNGWISQEQIQNAISLAMYGKRIYRYSPAHKERRYFGGYYHGSRPHSNMLWVKGSWVYHWYSSEAIDTVERIYNAMRSKGYFWESKSGKMYKLKKSK